MNVVACRIVRVLVLAGYVLAQCGMSLAGQIDVPNGAAYPCDGHGCGCTSAAHCWEKCCCMSPVQRLAWADEHHISPPTALVVAAHADEIAIEVCGSESACCHASHPESDSDERLATHWVLSIRAMKCAGHPGNGLVSSEPAVPANTFLVSFDFPFLGTMTGFEHSAANLSHPPHAPPG